MRTQYRTAGPRAVRSEPPASLARRLGATLLYVPPRVDPTLFYGRLLLYGLFVIWGWQFIQMTVPTNAIGESFMHNVNLVFHEAGHWIFAPFGEFTAILGGTLGQLLMPLIVTIALVWKNHDNFGGSIGLWWVAQSLMDAAPYVNDARAGRLILLGGMTGTDTPEAHDWRNILEDLGLLQHDQRIAAAVDGTGELLMWLAFAWGGVILYRQYRRTRF